MLTHKRYPIVGPSVNPSQVAFFNNAYMYYNKYFVVLEYPVWESIPHVCGGDPLFAFFLI